MDRKELARRAFEECCSPDTLMRRGGKDGPYWNVESIQFMYAPTFHFPGVRGYFRYRYDAVDEQGVKHSFEADNSCASLSPIWAGLPEGVVTLTVTALDRDGHDYVLAGARSFFRLASFPEETPPAVCRYEECAVRALRYAMSQDFVQYWLRHGRPDPAYDLNVYPCKMISSLVTAMLSLARLCPDEAEDAVRVAAAAADYLIAITPRKGAMADVPPTYSVDFCPDPEKYDALTPNRRAAEAHLNTVMMMYPASAGRAYLELAEATGERKYLEEAERIGRYYLKTVLPGGSWYLVRDAATGESTVSNCVAPMNEVVPFLTVLYKQTGDGCWKQLADGAVDYVIRQQLSTYNWEGQFEDTAVTARYQNLTHFAPEALAIYLLENRADDPASADTAEELMRYVEDQFVVWGRACPWPHARPESGEPYDETLWHTPAALEQYYWYVPIDSSTAAAARGFLALYKAGRGELWLAKALALTDQITRKQHEDGKIPTHWMNTEDAERNFWFNCMFHSCRVLEEMAPYQDQR